MAAAGYLTSTAAFVLLAAACCVLSLPPGSSAEACASGFIGLETLIGLATRTRLNVERQSVYPAINFTCDGSITSWTVLARRYTGNDDTMYPDLQVWRGEGGGAYTRVGSTTLSGGSDNEDDIYNYMLDNPLSFQAGDVFGMFQPQGSISRLMIHSQQDGGPPSYYVVTDSATDTLNESTATKFDDYPLITVTTEPPECANGFVTLERMRGTLTTLNGGRTVRYNSQNLFPNITFTCEANVSKWIIGGRTFDDRDSRPELQLWRLKPNTIADYQRVYTSGALADDGSTIADRVLEYPMDPPLTVQPGDVLGIYQPTSGSSRLRIFYEEDAGAEAFYQTISSSQDDFPAPAVSVQTHNDLPLVTVEVVCAALTPTPAEASTTAIDHLTLSDMVGTTSNVLPPISASVIQTSTHTIQIQTSICTVPLSPAQTPAPATSTILTTAGISAGVVVGVAILALLAASILLLKYCSQRKAGVLLPHTNDITASTKSANITGSTADSVGSEACPTSRLQHMYIEIHGNEAVAIADPARYRSRETHGSEPYQTSVIADPTKHTETHGNEAYQTTATAEPTDDIETHGDDAYQTAANADPTRSIETHGSDANQTATVNPTEYIDTHDNVAYQTAATADPTRYIETRGSEAYQVTYDIQVDEQDEEGALYAEPRFQVRQPQQPQ